MQNQKLTQPNPIFNSDSKLYLYCCADTSEDDLFFLTTSIEHVRDYFEICCDIEVYALNIHAASSSIDDLVKKHYNFNDNPLNVTCDVFELEVAA